MAAEYTYVGSELELFAAATVWKEYLRRQVDPYLGRNVLEVGAGMGGTAKLLCRPGRHGRWVGLEPDPALASQMSQAIAAGELPAECTVQVGTLETLPAGDRFDSLIYIDVMEHIEDDRAEAERAAERLSPGGHLVVLSPAHQWLFTPFDKAIGHHRRYSRSMMRSLAPPGCEAVRVRYLDSVGLLASSANKLMLQQSMPTPGQIRFWDKVLVRGSKLLDPLLLHSVGKSVLGVWRRTA